MIKRDSYSWKKIGLVLILLLFFTRAIPQQDIQQSHSSFETVEQKDTRMKWWREAKFGMFIHWGVYAVPAGVYKGEKVNRVSSWIMQYEHIPVAEYREYAKQFNPTKYNPERWVKLAKEAGMKYLVITAKHHDGFALFDSKVTDWDMVDATPYGKDLLKPLVQSCRDNAIKVGLYYSHGVDYVHPGGEAQSLDYKPGGHWDPVQKTKDMDTYFEEIAVPQVRELLTNYGEIDILWWDGGGWYNGNRKRADMILSVTNEYPNLLMNNRLGGDYPCDWRTPEQYIPATGLEYDWETCMTMNDTWGYRSWDDNWKSAKDLIFNLVDIVSKGGNYLLNIGPKADGTIPEASVDRLKTIGRWMSVNGESIYGTTANPFENITWGRCTKKIAENGNTSLYLHIFNWPKDGRLHIPALQNEILGVYLLADKDRTKREWRVGGNQLVLEVPTEAPDSICSVIRMDVKGTPIVMNPPRIEADAEILFDKMEVSLSTDVPDVNIHYTSNGNIPTDSSPVYEEGSPIIVTGNSTIKAALFLKNTRVSEVSKKDFKKQNPLSAQAIKNPKQGLIYSYYEGLWSQVPDFDKLEPQKEGIAYFCDVTKGIRDELFAMRFSGCINVPETGVYRFYAMHNDGCNIKIGEQYVLNSRTGIMDDAEKEEAKGIPVVLEKGMHPITVGYFQRIDHAVLDLFWSGPGFTKQPVKAQILFHGDME